MILKEFGGLGEAEGRREVERRESNFHFES